MTALRKVITRMPAASTTFARRLWASGLIADALGLGGWFAVSFWVAQFFPRIWPLAIALLCISIGGWKFLGLLAWRGLYAMSRDEPKRGARG